jgi:hypothetical protein
MPTKPKVDPERMTEWISPNEIIASGYGNISGKEWVDKEVDRINKKNGKASVKVVTTSKGHLAISR